MNKAEYIALVDEANKHSFLYYVSAQPVITDFQYDQIIRSLEDYELNNPGDIVPDSPTQQVGSDLNGNGHRVVAHRTPMRSQQKAHSLDGLSRFIGSVNNNNFVVTWKLDGISCSLVYLDGQLVEASTRGDGTKGQDILAHCLKIGGIPSTIAQEGRFEVRGEIVCPLSNLSSTQYCDPRTAAASICNTDVPTAACSLLMFYPWEIADSNYHYSDQLDVLSDIGFVSADKWHVSSVNDLSSLIDNLTSVRNGLSFPTDGLVIRVNDSAAYNAAGFNSHHPNGSIAYKFAPDSALTRVLDIEVKVAASGKRTPVAHIDPVVIKGRTISKVNLYSESTMRSLGVVTGSQVMVALANDVTPKIFSVLSPYNGSQPSPVSDKLNNISEHETTPKVDYSCQFEDLKNKLFTLSSAFVKKDDDKSSVNSVCDEDTRECYYNDLLFRQKEEEDAYLNKIDKASHVSAYKGAMIWCCAALLLLSIVMACVGFIAFLLPCIGGLFKAERLVQ